MCGFHICAHCLPAIGYSHMWTRRFDKWLVFYIHIESKDCFWWTVSDLDHSVITNCGKSDPKQPHTAQPRLFWQGSCAIFRISAVFCFDLGHLTVPEKLFFFCCFTFWGNPGNPVNSHTSSLFGCPIFPCPLYSTLVVFRWSICSVVLTVKQIQTTT